MSNKLFLILLCALYIVSIYSDNHKNNNYKPKVIGWYTHWSSRHKVLPLDISDIDASKLTHLNIAFLHVESNGSLSIEQSGKFVTNLIPLKKKYSHLKIFYAVGGVRSENFSRICKNDYLRKRLIKNLIEFAIKYGFDGIDIDWEVPGQPKGKDTEKDHIHFVTLLRELKKNIQERKCRLEVSVSVPGSKYKLKEYNLEEIVNYVSWLNVMTYNYAGAWSKKIFHHTALYPDIDASVTYLLHERNILPEKIVMGLALYGRSFKLEIPRRRWRRELKILGGINAGPGLGTFDKGAIAFWQIKQLPSSYKKFWDDKAKVPYLYNNKTYEVITYDNEKSLQLKCAYVIQHKLGGVMIWELWQDCRPSWLGLSEIYASL